MTSNRRDSLDTPHGSIALSPLPPVFKMSFCVLTTEKFTSREYDSTRLSSQSECFIFY
uniref:Uncharacterized protein n=1 Tax=Anguilla anguilla TaxID=7936 RepID=A0A0E9XQ90_ANGAN